MISPSISYHPSIHPPLLLLLLLLSLLLYYNCYFIWLFVNSVSLLYHPAIATACFYFSSETDFVSPRTTEIAPYSFVGAFLSPLFSVLTPSALTETDFAFIRIGTAYSYYTHCRRFISIAVSATKIIFSDRSSSSACRGEDAASIIFDLIIPTLRF